MATRSAAVLLAVTARFQPTKTSGILGSAGPDFL
jgi:hypothetical protein